MVVLVMVEANIPLKRRDRNQPVFDVCRVASNHYGLTSAICGLRCWHGDDRLWRVVSRDDDFCDRAGHGPEIVGDDCTELSIAVG